jgi:hypothetical protein
MPLPPRPGPSVASGTMRFAGCSKATDAWSKATDAWSKATDAWSKATDAWSKGGR